jgi:hypothetical protein
MLSLRQDKLGVAMSIPNGFVSESQRSSTDFAGSKAPVKSNKNKHRAGQGIVKTHFENRRSYQTACYF